MTEKEREDFRLHPWAWYAEPFRIIGNLWFVGNRSVGSYLLKTEKGPVLIDTTYPQTVPLLFHSLSLIGVRADSIHAILHTHGHYDHFGGTGFLKALSSCTAYLGRRDAEMFLHDKARSFVNEAGIDGFDVFRPDILLDECILDFGDVQIEVMETPGHSDGCLSFFFMQEGKRCGLFGGAGLNTLTDSYIRAHGNTHSRAEFISTLDRLEKEPVDVMLGNHTSQGDMLGKHMRSIEEGSPDAFVNPDDFPSFISSVRERAEREFC